MQTPKTHLTSRQFMELVSGDMPSREQRAAKAHLKACAQCRTELEAQQMSRAYWRTDEGQDRIRKVQERQLPEILAALRKAFPTEPRPASLWDRLVALGTEFETSAQDLQDTILSLLRGLESAGAVATASDGSEGHQWIAAPNGKIRATLGRRLENGDFQALAETTEAAFAEGGIWGWRLGDNFWPAQFAEVRTESGAKCWEARIWLTVENVPEDGPLPRFGVKEDAAGLAET